MVQLSVKPLPGDQNQKIAKKSAKLQQQKAREIENKRKTQEILLLTSTMSSLLWFGGGLWGRRERVQTTWPPISFEV